MFRRIKSFVIFRRGLELARAGQNEAAIEEFNVAIRLNPKNAKAYCGRGMAKSQLGLDSDAMTDYDKAVRLSPYDSGARALRGIQKVRYGQYESAIEDYDIAIRVKPRFATTYYKRAFAKAALGHRDAAIADYNESIRLNPNDEDAKLELNFMKNHGIQEILMLEILRKDPSADVIFLPNGAQEYMRRGRVLLLHNFFTMAILDFDEAIRLKKDFAHVYLMRGQAKSQLGQTAEAIQDFDDAINLNPDEDIACTCFMARSLSKSVLEIWDEAIEDMEKARKLAEKAGDTTRLESINGFIATSHQMRDVLRSENETTD